MRRIKTVEKEILRCKAQIKASYTHGEALSKQSIDVIESFQTKLDFLNNERLQIKTTKSIRVIDFRVVEPYRS
ncbi:hypothetical protein ES692_05985 [Psychroserpens burtonensis]|uniref:Uncharacterized protein n=1 Tax=Psychroserpens burtonensis TaxID=49278 RepID=A0A5C7B8E7_9FLAO|nr:hypothetical protein [Psychroserpens burtonensis]TXE18590.1 hypothetical protein ES692_05985 [Psychroserpens burtonensis]